MSIANRIQEIETHIENAYTSIDNLGIDISNTNKNIYNISALLDTFYESLPKVSGIGSNLSLSPTMVGKIKLNEIQGSTLQDGTPTPDTPVEIKNVTGLQNIEVCGKNLLPNLVNTQTLNGMTITKNDDGSLTFNGTANAGTNLNINYASGSYIHLESGKTYTASLTNNNGIYFRLAKVSGGNVATFDTPNKQVTFTSNYTGNCFAYLTVLNGTTFDNLTIYPQIELGNATPYEPYKGNTYEVNLGKNLLNLGTKSITTYYQESNLNIPAGTYTMSAKITSEDTQYTQSRAYLYNGNTQVGMFTLNRNSRSSATITLSTSADRIIIYSSIDYSSSNGKTATWEDIQLEKGSQATSYSPYFTPIELNKIGDYQDRIYKDNGKWYLEKKIGKVNLEDYEYNKYGASAGYSRNTTTQIPNIKYVSVNTELGKGLCEKYQIHKGAGMSGSDAENHFAIDVSMFQVSIPSNDTPSGLFYYVLATPEITEITNTELIEDLETLYTAKSQEGTTNISITSEDLEMILNVSVLKGDVE